MNKFKHHLKAHQENKEAIELKIDKININLTKLNESLITRRSALDFLSNIRNIYKDIKKETAYIMRLLNDLLLEINIELTYNTLVSYKSIDQTFPEEEEKKVQGSQETIHYSIYDRPITVPFITNLSSSRLSVMSSKLTETMYLSNTKNKKILEFNRIMKMISTLIKEMEEI